MNLLPGEIVPSPDALEDYDGLENIRFRKDGRLAIGLFYRKEDNKPVVTISPNKKAEPFVFDVEPEEANAAFEEPWPYAPATGKIILEAALAPSLVLQGA